MKKFFIFLILVFLLSISVNAVTWKDYVLNCTNATREVNCDTQGDCSLLYDGSEVGLYSDSKVLGDYDDHEMFFNFNETIYLKVTNGKLTSTQDGSDSVPQNISIYTCFDSDCIEILNYGHSDQYILCGNKQNFSFTTLNDGLIKANKLKIVYDTTTFNNGNMCYSCTGNDIGTVYLYEFYLTSEIYTESQINNNSLPEYNLSYDNQLCFNDTLESISTYVNFSAYDPNNDNIYYSFGYNEPNKKVIFEKTFETWKGLIPFRDYSYQNGTFFYSTCKYMEFPYWETILNPNDISLINIPYFHSTGFQLYLDGDKCEVTEDSGELYDFYIENVNNQNHLIETNIYLEKNQEVTLSSYGTDWINNITLKRTNTNIEIYEKNSLIHNITEPTDYGIYKLLINNSFDNQKYNFRFAHALSTSPIQNKLIVNFTSSDYTFNTTNLYKIFFNYGRFNYSFGVDKLKLSVYEPVLPIWKSYNSYDGTFIFSDSGEYEYLMFITDEYGKNTNNYTTEILHFSVMEGDYCYSSQIKNTIEKDIEDFEEGFSTGIPFFDAIIILIKIPAKLFKTFNLLDEIKILGSAILIFLPFYLEWKEQREFRLKGVQKDINLTPLLLKCWIISLFFMIAEFTTIIYFIGYSVLFGIMIALEVRKSMVSS